MPIDRAATLRNAEKLIRQGKLPDAIAEYVRLVEDQPGDWNLQNSLGDLEKLLDRALGLARTRVEIAERVRRVPVAGLILDDTQVFGGCGFEFALTQQFFGVSKCPVAIE